MPSRKQPTTKVRKDVPAAAEFGRLRSHLARMGVKQAELGRDAIGDDIDNRNRAEIAARLRAWLKERPKA